MLSNISIIIININIISSTRPAVKVVAITGSVVPGIGDIDWDGGGSKEEEAFKDVV